MILDEVLAATRFQSYVYAYPHKTAYRRIEPALPLGPLWATEPRRDALFMYVHVPFCEQRCGFCNLFTRPVPPAELVEAYLATLTRQAEIVRRALESGGRFAFARAAIGGGTPTLLDAHQLARLLELMQLPAGIPMSVETSPETAMPDRLAVLVGGGADRISIGVQSFLESECCVVNRPQDAAEVHRALRAIRDAGPATLNVDLMYGLPGQTPATWQVTLAHTLEYAPEEIYLYPLYVRPLTTLGKKGAAAIDATRIELYERARAELLTKGYRQISLRMFRRGAMPPLVTIADHYKEWKDPRIVVVALNNGDLNMVTWEQRVMAGNPKYEVSQRLPKFPYAKYADLLGLTGIDVRVPGEIGSAFERAFASDRPVVVECHTDPEVPPLPPHIDFKQARNFASSVLHGDPHRWRMVEQSAKQIWAKL